MEKDFVKAFRNRRGAEQFCENDDDYSFRPLEHAGFTISPYAKRLHIGDKFYYDCEHKRIATIIDIDDIYETFEVELDTGEHEFISMSQVEKRNSICPIRAKK